MDSDHVFVLLLALALVGAAVALAYAYPELLNGGSDDVGGASLSSFDASAPHCAGPESVNATSSTRDLDGGEALVINETIPVASNDTEVTAGLGEFGPRRYILEIRRQTTNNSTDGTPTPVPGAPAGGNQTEGNATRADGDACQLEVRYNATIRITHPNDYTVVVTYDGEFVGGYWREGSNTGSVDTAPDRPMTPAGENETGTDRSNGVAPVRGPSGDRQSA